MLRWLGYLWPCPLTLIFDLEFSRSNCISGMGGSIVMERKGQESLGCPDVKHNHYVTPRQRILLPTGWLKMSAFPSTRLVSYQFPARTSYEVLVKYHGHFLEKFLRVSYVVYIEDSNELLLWFASTLNSNEFHINWLAQSSDMTYIKIIWNIHIIFIRSTRISYELITKSILAISYQMHVNEPTPHHTEIVYMHDRYVGFDARNGYLWYG